MGRASSTPAGAFAGRVDFEILRSREWRDGVFTPLDGGDEPADATGTAPGELVIARAERLLGSGGTSPGKRAALALDLLALLVIGLGAVAGIELGRRALGHGEAGPVNILWFLVHALGAQSIFLLLTVVAVVAATARGGATTRLLGAAAQLGSWLLGAALRVAARTAINAAGVDPGALSVVSRRLRHLATLKPLALALSNAAWVAYNLGFLASAGLLLSAEHHTFGWQSTLLDGERAGRLIATLTAPARLWPGAVSREQIAVSRYAPDERRFVDDGDDPNRALTLRQAWATQLMASVVALGLVPRLTLLAAAVWAWRRARGRLLPDASDPYVAAVLDRLTPPVETYTGPVVGDVVTEVELAPRTPADAMPSRWWVGPYLSAAPGGDTVEVLWGGPREGWTALARLDRREHEREALAAVSAEPGRGLVLLCDYALTPDRALGALLAKLRDAARSPVVVILLSGGQAFRDTRIGASAGGVAARREVWREAASRWGVAADDLIDFDVASATAESRKLLERLLSGGSSGVSGKPMSASTVAAVAGASNPASSAANAEQGLEPALNAIDDAATTWASALSAAQPQDRDALTLQLAARARLMVDQTFGSTATASTPGRADAIAAPLRAALEAAIRKEFRSVEPAALIAAASSLGAMTSMLARVKDLDPRYVIAGLAAGLVAGPLGGLIAAGGAGLVAGASLMSTLGALGALLGGTAAMRRQAAERGAGIADGDERLGVVARSAVVRALVLSGQGRGEARIAEEIQALARRTASCDISTPEDVRSLTAMLLTRERTA